MDAIANATVILATAVANNGTLTVAYPTGITRNMLFDSLGGVAVVLILGQFGKLVQSIILAMPEAARKPPACPCPTRPRSAMEPRN